MSDTLKADTVAALEWAIDRASAVPGSKKVQAYAIALRALADSLREAEDVTGRWKPCWIIPVPRKP